MLIQVYVNATLIDTVEESGTSYSPARVLQQVSQRHTLQFHDQIRMVPVSTVPLGVD